MIECPGISQPYPPKKRSFGHNSNSDSDLICRFLRREQAGLLCGPHGIQMSISQVLTVLINLMSDTLLAVSDDSHKFLTYY